MHTFPTSPIRCRYPAVVSFVLAFGVGSVAAQQPPGPPGDPDVTVNGFNVNVRWTAPTTGGPVSGYQLLVTRDGANFPGSPFNLPSTTTQGAGGPLPVGAQTGTGPVNVETPSLDSSRVKEP